MCFSAGASFGASALLIGAGIFTIKKVESPKKLAFASVPILFGVQQFTEGILWLSLLNPTFATWEQTSVYIFLFFAQVIWPLCIPFGVWMMEPNKKRRKWISVFLAIGAVISGYLFYCLFVYDVSAYIENRHIRYRLHFPYLNLRLLLYFLATVIPLFLSSLRLMKLLGTVCLGSLVLSYIFFFHYVISVWCFFAAVLSVLIFLVIVYNQEPLKNTPFFLKRGVFGFRQRTN